MEWTIRVDTVHKFVYDSQWRLSSPVPLLALRLSNLRRKGVITLTFRELIKLLEDAGYREVLPRKGSSHRKFVHPTRTQVQVAGKLSSDVAKGTLNKILKDAQLK